MTTPGKRKSKSEKERREESAISLQAIFFKFSTNRAKRKGQAYKELQQDLAENAETLIMSGQITMKEIVSTIKELEDYLQEEEVPDGDDPITYLSKWLRGEIKGDEFDSPEMIQGAREDLHVT